VRGLWGEMDVEPTPFPFMNVKKASLHSILLLYQVYRASCLSLAGSPDSSHNDVDIDLRTNFLARIRSSAKV